MSEAELCAVCRVLFVLDSVSLWMRSLVCALLGWLERLVFAFDSFLACFAHHVIGRVVKVSEYCT